MTVAAIDETVVPAVPAVVKKPAGLFRRALRLWRVRIGLFLLFCCFEVFFAALLTILAEWLLEAIPWWTILGGNLLAAIVMLGFFFREHRVTWREFLHARR